MKENSDIFEKGSDFALFLCYARGLLRLRHGEKNAALGKPGRSNRKTSQVRRSVGRIGLDDPAATLYVGSRGGVKKVVLNRGEQLVVARPPSPFAFQKDELGPVATPHQVMEDLAHHVPILDQDKF